MPTIQALLDEGEATRGFTVKIRGGHLILGRVDEAGPDPRFRLTPLGGGRYGLSLYDRNRWDPLPYEGTLNELVEVINTDPGGLGSRVAGASFIGPRIFGILYLANPCRRQRCAV